MMRLTRPAAALALGLGLSAAGLALAQTPSGGAPPPASDQPTPPAASSDAPATNSIGASPDQPVYSVPAPPDSSSGIYLPAVVGGYVKSTTSCVVVGCDDGPDVGGSSASPSSGSDQPAPLPPENPGPSGSH